MLCGFFVVRVSGYFARSPRRTGAALIYEKKSRVVCRAELWIHSGFSGIHVSHARMCIMQCGATSGYRAAGGATATSWRPAALPCVWPTPYQYIGYWRFGWMLLINEARVTHMQFPTKRGISR